VIELAWAKLKNARTRNVPGDINVGILQEVI
jgi:hypothetical protein